MSDPTRALTVQLLDWISSRPRTYAEVMDAWRTTCPRLSIWEDACLAGLIETATGNEVVRLSEKGERLLLEQRSLAVPRSDSQDD